MWILLEAFLSFLSLLKGCQGGANWNIHMNGLFVFSFSLGILQLLCSWVLLVRASAMVYSSHTVAMVLSRTGLALTTLARTHWHFELILFCYWSFGFDYTAFALGLSSCARFIPVGPWIIWIKWLDFITEDHYLIPLPLVFLLPRRDVSMT